MDEVKNNNISIDKLDSPFIQDALKQEILPKNPDKFSKGLDINEINIIKNCYKKNNYVEKEENKFKNKNISKIDDKINVKDNKIYLKKGKSIYTEEYYYKEYYYQEYYNILVLGNSRVGKTALCRRFKGDSFHERYLPTIDFDYSIIEDFQINSKKKFKVWDSSGQERFRPYNYYFERDDIIILVYDVTNKESFYDLDIWIEDIKDYYDYDYWDKFNIGILIGNKCDMEDKRVISFRQGSEFAINNGLEYIETSVKENINIHEILEIISDRIDKNISRKTMIIIPDYEII